jgi:predicted AAA+ superfamily ATPase
MNERYLKESILEQLGKKIIILMGPRQVGKTTLSKNLHSSYAYYNYDIKKDLAVFLDQHWDREKKLVIFDELHKMKKWKLWLKGIYDEGLHQQILVTGSARLDIAKKMGDSLAGRFFSFRLNPLDLKELKGTGSVEENYNKLIKFGGFPEPYFQASSKFYGLWKKGHSDLIIRQDMLSLESVKDIDGIETLIEMLSTRVQHTISVSSIAKDIGRDDKTIARWLLALENMYIIFKVAPYSTGVPRAKKKMSKYFFYDLGQVNGDEGAKLENLVALSLKKEIEFDEDVNGISGQLYFTQNKQQNEIDFVVKQRGRNLKLIEVKLSDAQPSHHFRLFAKYFKDAEKIQLVRNLDRSFQTKEGVKVKKALSYLESINLKDDNN